MEATSAKTTSSVCRTFTAEPEAPSVVLRANSHSSVRIGFRGKRRRQEASAGQADRELTRVSTDPQRFRADRVRQSKVDDDRFRGIEQFAPDRYLHGQIRCGINHAVLRYRAAIDAHFHSLSRMRGLDEDMRVEREDQPVIRLGQLTGIDGQARIFPRAPDTPIFRIAPTPIKHFQPY